MNKWILIMILVTLEIVGQYSLDYSITKKQILFKYAGIILYAVSGYFYYELIRQTKDLGLANILWTCGTFIGITILSITLGEEKPTVQKMVASVLMIGAVLLYSTEGVKLVRGGKN